MEKIAYIIMLLLAALWIGVITLGMIEAMPYGIFGLLAIIAIGILFIKVLKDRISNKEDNYYDKNVDK